MFRRPNPKSNWRRPKPKIYDCNTRDLEKFYQDSYGEYLSTKNDIRAREMDRQNRGDPEELTRRFETRRASSLVYGEDDTPRSHRFIPSRQTSHEGDSEHSSARSSYLRNRTEITETSDLPRDVRSTTSASKTVTFSNSLNDDTGSEMAGIEQRLERLKRLREELGLPADNTGGASSSSRASDSTYSSKSRSALRNGLGEEETSYSSKTSKYSAPAADEESTYSSRTSRFKSSTTDDDTPSYTSKSTRFKSSTGDDDASSYSTKNSRFKSTAGDEDASSYSVKSTRFKLPESNGVDSSYESKSSYKSKSRVPKPSLDDIDMTFDDDALLTDMRKKMPSSSEILDRIKNMDIE